MRRIIATLLVLVSLAGCASDGADPATGLKATEDTGILRGVVVDEAVVPVENVSVVLELRGEPVAQGTTDAAGEFGFQALDPGFYIVRLEKTGWRDAQVQAEVVAGKDEPPLVKVQMARIPGFDPFVNQFTWAGYIQCNSTYANVCLIINYYPDFLLGTGPITDDESYHTFYEEFVDVGRVPTHTQVETVWDSTQTLGENMVIRYQADRPDTLLIDCPYGAGGSVDSTSPQTFIINGSKAAYMGLGAAREDDDPDDNCDPTEPNGLGMEFFAGDTLGMCQDLPVVGCHPRVGVVVEQRTQTFVHAFYDYVPPTDWTFVGDASVPPP